MNRRTEPTVADIHQALKEGRTRKYDVELPNGVKLKNINNDDNRRAKELIASIGPITQTITTRAAIPEAPRTLGPVLRTATKSYVKELMKSKLTKQKSIEDKEATYEQFATQFDNPKCGEIDKASFSPLAVRRGRRPPVDAKPTPACEPISSPRRSPGRRF